MRKAGRARGVVADAGYGVSGPFRRELEARGLSYVMAVTEQMVVFAQEPRWEWPREAQSAARLHQILRGLRWSYPLEIEGWKDAVDRAKWRLWHGQVDRTDQAPGELAADLDPRLGPATPPWSSPLLRLRSAVGEVQAYLRANAASLVDYARRYLRGQRISTAVVESMVNRVIGRRMAKKQPMRWSRRGAHLLVQIRMAVLDGRFPQLLQRWYPRFRPPDPTAA